MTYKKPDPTRIKGNGDILLEGQKIGVIIIDKKKKYALFYFGLDSKELKIVAKMMEEK